MLRHCPDREARWPCETIGGGEPRLCSAPLLGAQPTEDCHQFVRRCSILCRSYCSRFAETVRRTVRESGLVAPRSESPGEACGRKRFAVLGNETRQGPCDA